MLIVSNCKSYVIEKFCIVCDTDKDNHCEHADLNGDGDVDGDGDDHEDINLPIIFRIVMVMIIIKGF